MGKASATRRPESRCSVLEVEGLTFEGSSSLDRLMGGRKVFLNALFFLCACGYSCDVKLWEAESERAPDSALKEAIILLED
jgi:hypothetical protein